MPANMAGIFHVLIRPEHTRQGRQTSAFCHLRPHSLVQAHVFLPRHAKFVNHARHPKTPTTCAATRETKMKSSNTHLNHKNAEGLEAFWTGAQRRAP